MSNSTANPRIVIVKKSTAAGRFLHLNTNRGQLSVATSGQIHGHSSTSNIFSFGVAAAFAGAAYPNPFTTSNVIETFSSDGPRRVFFLEDGTAITPGNVSSTGGALLQKPDLTAADGTFVTGAGDFPGQFFGTSAAAPNAAAITALIKSANPGFTQSQIRSALLASAIDIEAPGVDRDSGVGIVMATAPQPGCTFALSPMTLSPTAAGASGTITVTASSGSCNWVAWSNVPWMNVTNGVNTGSGSFNYFINANPGPARTGTLMIQGGQTVTVTQAGTPATPFATTTTMVIADNVTQESPLSVTGVAGPITNLSVSFHLTHTFDADLTISLIGPDGTAVPLSAENGGSANNFGSACSPLTSRSTFDDSATTLITHGGAPFVGTFRPEKPLAAFNGKAGVGANGTWKLRIADSFAGDTGTLQCWTLNVNQGPPTDGPPIRVSDFDGDVFADLPIYRANGDWAVLKSGGGYTSSIMKNFGGPGYVPAPGDYDGDGKIDLGVYQEATGQWLALTSSSNYTSTFSINWGGPGYRPVPGDYDADGRTDPTVYQTSTGQWSILKSGTGFTTTAGAGWGGPGYTPIGGQDFDGDSKSDLAVYRQATGVWSILTSSSSYTASMGMSWGGPGFTLVPGDYDGDSKADFGVYQRSTGTWYILKSEAAYTTAFSQGWGGVGYLPVPADYDGDARIDLGIFQPSTGNWHVLKSSTNYTTAMSMPAFGGASDVPVSSAIFVGGDDTTRKSDYDGDVQSEITVYNTTSGVWSSLLSASNYTSATNIGWGGVGYTPAPGDYDGDGKSDLAIYQESSGNWYVLLSGSGFTTSLSRTAGGPGWQPVAGDYDGDGKTDFAVYNTSSGQWFALNSSTGYTTSLSIGWGGSGYTAAPADFDGDGRTDLSIYEGSTGNWYVLLSASNFTTSLSKSAGGPGYTPAQGDYDGDGKADFVVHNESTGLWYGLKSSSGYTTTVSVSWGGSGYTPVRGDYDGDGKMDLSIYQTSTGNWYILLSSSNYTTSLSKSFGGAGYVPLPSFP
jgi:subtilisin-like proprotein convertase family protein